MGDPGRLFDRFAAERRSAAIPGYDLHALPGLTRYTSRAQGGEGFAVFAQFGDGDADGFIRDTISFYADRGQDFEWKVYELDSPADLKERLERAGFRAQHEEAFLVMPVDGAATTTPDRGGDLDVVQADPTNAVIEDAVALQEQVWGVRFSFLRAQLRMALAAGNCAIFCAYRDARPVASGWVDYVPGSTFADLHGGAVAEDARGEGIYSRLLHARMQHARARGCRYLAVDAAPMSRPILEKKGFVRVCATYPMRLKPYGIPR